MQTVERVVSEVERKRAEALAISERRVAECETKLAELEGYQKTYADQFQQRVGAGDGAASLRDFQVFMARLADAVKQQAQIVSKARADRDAERLKWQHAAQRSEAVGTLVERWKGEEQRALDRREQSESDERAQRSPAHQIQSSGN